MSSKCHKWKMIFSVQDQWTNVIKMYELLWKCSVAQHRFYTVRPTIMFWCWHKQIFKATARHIAIHIYKMLQKVFDPSLPSDALTLLQLQGELIRMISRITHSKLQVWVANSWKAHSKIKMWVTLWAHCEITECPQNEPTVSSSVSSQWVSCELKFFTGFLSVCHD